MFRIMVEEIKEVEKLEKEYQLIADTGGADGGPKYGYVQTKNVVEVSNNVYTQEVAEIDLVAVINAVNKVNKLEVIEPVIKEKK